MCNLFSKIALFACLFLTSTLTFAQLYEVPLDQRIDQSEVIVEGEVISSESFHGSDDNIYTSHRVAVSTVLTANQVPSTVEVITFGGELDDEFQTWTHLLTLNQGDKGVFFLNAAKPKDAYFRSAVTAYDVYASSQGFVQYRTNEAQALIAIEPFKQYDDVEQEIFARIEQKKGHKATLPESASVAMFRTGIRFHFKNIAFDGLKVKFDLYVNSLVGNKVLNSAGIQLSYNPVFFGPSVVNNGGLSVFENGISLDYGYDFSAADVSSTTTKISLLPNPALGGKVEIGANEQLLGRGEFVIQNPLVDPGITYNIEQSKAFNTYFEEGVNKQFDTVVVVGSWREDCLTIYDVSPDTVAAGVSDIITIRGKCFGPFIEGTTAVLFTDASSGPAPLACEPLTTDYYNSSCGFPSIICWSDSLIRVKVPTVHQKTLTSFTNSIYAGTGRVAVVTASSLVSSPDTLFVKYAAFNSYTSASQTPAKTALPWTLRDANGIGGFTMTYGTGMLADTAARGCFERALNSWRCATKINYVFDPAHPNLNGLICNIDIVDTFSGVSSTLAVTVSKPENCDASGVYIKAYLVKFDMMFNKKVKFYKKEDLSGIDTSFHDMQSVALHELGHAHLLDHVNNSDPMFAFLPKNVVRRTLTPFDIEGGKKMMQINNAIFSGSNCNSSVMQPYNCIISTDEVTLHQHTIFPNPASNLVNLPTVFVGSQNWVYLYDVYGRLIYTGECQPTLDVSHFGSGLIFGRIAKSNQIHYTFKLIKQ